MPFGKRSPVTKAAEPMAATIDTPSRFSDGAEAIKHLRFQLRRVGAAFEGNAKMANLEHAGPFNAEKRRDSLKACLKDALKATREVYEEVINGL